LVAQQAECPPLARGLADSVLNRCESLRVFIVVFSLYGSSFVAADSVVVCAVLALKQLDASWCDRVACWVRTRPLDLDLPLERLADLRNQVRC
jgi:hypothetical protein